MNVSIRSTELKAEGGKTFTRYCITVGDSAQASAARRYNEFLDFHTTMSKSNPDLQFPPFPPKAWFGNMKAAFILERASALEEYLRGLVLIFRNRPQEEDALRVFCGMPSRYHR
eukprot:g3341.t1